ncbi:MAG: hypothetical protein AAF719_01160 [Pseudomonadota bacterium]
MSIKSIGLSTLYELGYRVCHSQNVSIAANTLRRVKDGAVTHDEIDKAIRALEYAPLSQANVVEVARDS